MFGLGKVVIEMTIPIERNYTTILVGVDESKTASLAVDRAIHMAKIDGAELIIATLINSHEMMGISRSATFGFGGVTPDMIEDMEDDLRSIVEKYAQRAKDQDVKVTTIVDFGDPRAELAEKIPAKYGVDLIVVGATGVNLVNRLMLGSTADYVIRNAKCDVYIVHHLRDAKGKPIK